MRSTTCTGSNNQFLQEYHTLHAAEIAAKETQQKFGRSVTPVQCNKCGYWHLTTVNTRKQCLFCSDSALFQKDLYATKQEAQKTADYLRREKRVELFPYKCPHSHGWHLTKRKG